jgi:hypothetical protein
VGPGGAMSAFRSGGVMSGQVGLCQVMWGYVRSGGAIVLFICLSSARQQSVFAYPKQRATVLKSAFF